MGSPFFVDILLVFIKIIYRFEPMRYLDVRYKVGLLVIAYLALLLHAFIPHHHHFDNHQIFIGDTHDCHSHTGQNESQHHSGHSPGECSTIQHSLKSLSYSYNSDDVFSDISKFPSLHPVFQNFIFAYPGLDWYADYPIPDIIPLVDYALITVALFRGPPDLIS